MSRSFLIRSLCWGLFIVVSALAMGGCDEKLSDITGPTPNLEPTLSSIQSEISRSSAFAVTPAPDAFCRAS